MMTEDATMTEEINNDGGQTPKCFNSRTTSHHLDEENSTIPTVNSNSESNSVSSNDSGGSSPSVVQNAYRSYLHLIRDGGYSPYLNKPVTPHNKKKEDAKQALASSPAVAEDGAIYNIANSYGNESMLESDDDDTPISTSNSESEVHAMALANRTSDIMNSYEAYLAEINDAASPIARKPKQLQHYQLDDNDSGRIDFHSVSTKSNDGGQYNNRDLWGPRKGSEGSLSSIVDLRVVHGMDVKLNDDWINLAEDMDKLEEGQRFRKVKSIMKSPKVKAIMKSTKLKRHVLGWAILLFVVCLVLGVSLNKDNDSQHDEPVSNLELPQHMVKVPPKPESNEKTEPNTPLPPNDLNSMPDQQMGDYHKSQDTAMSKPSATSIQNIETSSSNESNEKVQKASEPEGVQAITGNQHTTKYEPKWFDRSQGWKGKTYIDAISFCAAQDSNIPCPYEAICPDGAGSVPWGGGRPEAEAWAPIIDVPNGWVSVSSTATNVASCLDYNSVHTHPPLWGVLGQHYVEDKEVDHTPSVMCCQAPLDGEVNNSDQVQGSRHEVEESRTMHEQDVMDKLKPMWFGRKQGYHGTTHNHASDFCKSVGNMHLCPREAYCPNGPGSSKKPLFLEQEAFEGEQWAPVVGTEGAIDENEWVLIGTVDERPDNTCMSHNQVHTGEDPEWGLDGTRTELKENILCCQNPKELPREQDLLKKLDPIWLDESHGWTGGSHDDANEFCDTLGNRKLCPFAAYCPFGPGQPVTGGHSQDFNTVGEQWAPVDGKKNHWVMIGKKYENFATTCMDNYELEGGEPYWGLNAERAEVKSHIMCCEIQK